MYAITDVSATTSKRVIRQRRLGRCGIVIHETIGSGSLAWLQGGSAAAGQPASSDYLIDKSGLIYQITPPGWYAYHSGVAKWRGYQEEDKSINQGFVGIELENNPEIGERIETPQYMALGWLVRRLVFAHYIDMRNIAGHGQVALPPGRKTDPITLNWSILTNELMNPSHEQSFYVSRGELS